MKISWKRTILPILFATPKIFGMDLTYEWGKMWLISLHRSNQKRWNFNEKFIPGVAEVGKVPKFWIESENISYFWSKVAIFFQKNAWNDTSDPFPQIYQKFGSYSSFYVSFRALFLTLVSIVIFLVMQHFSVKLPTVHGCHWPFFNVKVFEDNF